MAGAQVDVYVKLTSGRVVPLKVLATDTIASLCTHVASADKSVPLARIALKYLDKCLDKSKTVAEYGIGKETILKVEVLASRELRVYVKLDSGRAVPFTIESTRTVNQLKSAIEDAEDVAKNRQRLYLGSRELRSGLSTLEEVGVAQEAVLNLEVAPEAVASAATVTTPDRAPEIDDARQQEILSSFISGVASSSKPVEVVFSFDTTGSMYSCLDQVRSKLRESVQRLLQDISHIRIGVIAHGDYCDQDSSYVLRHQDLTSDVNKIVKFVKDVPSTGGGDCPECYEWVLRRAQQLSWQQDSAKALVVIGDATPHPPSYTDQRVNWRDELETLVQMGIKVYGVQALGRSESVPFYEELAERSGGAYITFSHFQLITDMFLAVCYKEASDEQFHAYQLELATEGKMTEELGDIFEAIEKKDADSEKTAEKKKEKEKKRRNLSSPWWDTKYDNSTSPQYTYDAKRDHWKSWSSKRSASTYSPVTPAFKSSASAKKKTKSKSKSPHYSSSDSSEMKIVVAGAGGVGKSALTVQFVQGVFLDEYDPTIEDSYRKSYCVDDKPVLLDILDTAGSDEFASMTDVWYRCAHGFLLVYAIDNRSSFDEIESFWKRICRVKDDDAVACVLVGNKTDLDYDRQVSKKEGEALARRLGVQFYESCAKEGETTTPAFDMVARQIGVDATKAKKRSSKKRCSIM